MKKLSMIAIIIMVMALPGCSGKEKQAVDPVASDNSQTKEEVQETDMKDEKNISNTEATGTEDTAAAENKTTEPGVAENKTTEAEAVTTEAENAEAKTGPTPVPEGIVIPLTTNSSGKVMIQTVSKSTSYPYNTYIITSVNGESIVLDPTAMPKKEECDLNPVAILSTHSHPDHIDSTFTSSYDCEQLMYKKGEITTKDFHIYTIPASHDGDYFTENSSNVIVVIEVDGLRIAHMGDVGQTALTEDQLKELGEIDIAFMQYENSYSSMTLDNKKGFNMMDQLKPKLIIPTHYSNAALPVFEEKYGAITEVENVLEIAKEDIPDEIKMYRVLNNHVYKVN